tara:strand:- start:290 stop:820 length:531 start_codon:yes stop_codon:yes gene_type:complete
MADWRQLLTTGDVGALHTDASVYGHLFELPADLAGYTFVGDEGFGDVFKDTGSGTFNPGSVYFKNGASWAGAQAGSDDFGAKRQVGISLSATDPIFLLNGYAALPLQQFTGLTDVADVGKSLYLSVEAGKLTIIPPYDAGNAIRVLGTVLAIHAPSSSIEGVIIKFDPSSVWIEQE